MQKKYKELYLQYEKEGYKIADKKSKEIYKKQKEDREKLLNEIGRLVLAYSILDLTSKQRRKLNKKFSATIENMTKEQNKHEKKVIEVILKTVTKEKYYKDAYLTSIGMDFKMKRFSDKKMKINSTIDGKIWSNRLWKNKKQLEKQLKKEINRLFQGKTNVNDIEKIIKKEFNQNAFNTKRLVETEVGRCQNQANEYFAKEHGVEKQMFVATLDDRTSEFCQEHDGIIYEIDDSNKPSLPAHPFCRSCYISVIDDWEFTTRKDNTTKEYIDFMTYEEWKEENNIN